MAVSDNNHEILARRRPKTGRRFLQISLRTSLVLTTLFAIGLGYLCKRARDQKIAVHRVLELGGSITYDFELDKGRRVENAVPAGPAWLRQLVGNEFFQEVTRVYLDRTKVTDADLRLIGSLRHLDLLSLNETDISDAGLSHITGLRKLSYLGLYDSKVTGAGLRYVQNLRSLDTLVLQGTAVDDDGLKHLADLPRLGMLNLGGTRVTSKGMSQLKVVDSLYYLTLQDTAVDDSAIPDLAEMVHLTDLYAIGTGFSGEGLLELRSKLKDCQVEGDWEDVGNRKFNSASGVAAWDRIVQRLQLLSAEGRLKLIDLSDTDLSDAHLSTLRNLPGVQMIDFRHTRVTNEGLEELQQALPHCKFRHDSNAP